MAERLLGPTEVASRIGKSRWTVRRYAELGILPHVRLGDRLVFPEAALDAWLVTQSMTALASTADAGTDDSRQEAAA